MSTSTIASNTSLEQILYNLIDRLASAQNTDKTQDSKFSQVLKFTSAGPQSGDEQHIQQDFAQTQQQAQSILQNLSSLQSALVSIPQTTDQATSKNTTSYSAQDQLQDANSNNTFLGTYAVTYANRPDLSLPGAVGYMNGDQMYQAAQKYAATALSAAYACSDFGTTNLYTATSDGLDANGQSAVKLPTQDELDQLFQYATAAGLTKADMAKITGRDAQYIDQMMNDWTKAGLKVTELAATERQPVVAPLSQAALNQYIQSGAYKPAVVYADPDKNYAAYLQEYSLNNGG